MSFDRSQQWSASLPPLAPKTQNIYSRHRHPQQPPSSSAFVNSLPQSYQHRPVSSSVLSQHPISSALAFSHVSSYPGSSSSVSSDPTREFQSQSMSNGISSPYSSTSSMAFKKTGFEGGVGFDVTTIKEQSEVAMNTENLSADLGRGPSFVPQVMQLGFRASTSASAGGPRTYAYGGSSPLIAPVRKDENIASGFVDGLAVGGQLGGRLGGPLEESEMLDKTNDQDEDELPLLEELGINLDYIAMRIKAALLFYRLDHDLLVDIDMCGPLFIAACLGCSLLLAGKIHFAYIYGLSVTGCLFMCILLNLMSQKEGIDLYRTTSILGYALLPVDILAFISIFCSLRNLAGTFLSVLCVTWCTATASRFFETALQMHNQRFLVAYPIALIYACFVLITVF